MEEANHPRKQEPHSIEQQDAAPKTSQRATLALGVAGLVLAIASQYIVWEQGSAALNATINEGKRVAVTQRQLAKQAAKSEQRRYLTNQRRGAYAQLVVNARYEYIAAIGVRRSIARNSPLSLSEEDFAELYSGCRRSALDVTLLGPRKMAKKAGRLGDKCEDLAIRSKFAIRRYRIKDQNAYQMSIRRLLRATFSFARHGGRIIQGLPFDGLS